MKKKSIQVQKIGTFLIEQRGWGRWKHFPGNSEENAEYVYIVVGKDAKTLYVGRTVNVAYRMQGHVKKPWFTEALMVVVYEVSGENKMDAEFSTWEVEKRFIQSLKPEHNKRPGSKVKVSRYSLNPYSATEYEDIERDRSDWEIVPVGVVP